jgi:threonine/homoserine efflux transporter RhtA
MGRRLTISLSFLMAALACVPIFLTVSQPEYDIVTIVFAIAIKFSTSITFYVVNLHAMETYPTCLRQTGLSIGSIVANFLGECVEIEIDGWLSVLTI